MRYAMRRPLTSLICILLCAATAIGCSNSSLKTSASLETEFRNLVPVDDLNTSLRIQAKITDRTEFGARNSIRVEIENFSDERILVRQPEDIKLLLRSDDNWVEVENAVEYYGGEGPILYPAVVDPLRNRTLTSVRPVLGSEPGDGTTKQLLRIVIIGEILSDVGRTGSLVAAYTDLILESP
jgi:hypothetical protein